MKKQKVSLQYCIDVFIEKILSTPLGYRLWIKFFNARMRNTLECILPPLDQGKRVLDVGCGPGLNSGIFANCVYLGIDINERYVKTAQKLHPGKKFEVQDIRQLECSRLFDVVLILSVLHHLSDNEASSLLSSVYNLVDRNGVVLIQEPIIPESNEWIAQLCMRFDRGKFFRQLPHWHQLVEESGFRVDEKICYKLKLFIFPCTYNVLVARLVKQPS